MEVNIVKLSDIIDGMNKEEANSFINKLIASFAVNKKHASAKDYFTEKNGLRVLFKRTKDL